MTGADGHPARGTGPRASIVAEFLSQELLGEDGEIFRPADLQDCAPGTLVWVRSFSEERLALLEAGRPALAICDPETAARTTVPRVSSRNPRLDFAHVLQRFFAPERPVGIHPTAIVAPEARVGQGVSIGAYARIEADVSIGDGTVIGSGVAIEGEVEIGRDCVIKPNAVIGAAGFGFEYDEDGHPIHFPHLGKVVLEDEVWLGSCSTIERATLGVTLVRHGCKIDDLVQIGHNTAIGPNTLVMANAVICGGAVIGEGCWIAPNSVIKQKVTIGDGVTVGLGAVVLKGVPDGLTVAGVPARPLER